MFPGLVSWVSRMVTGDAFEADGITPSSSPWIPSIFITPKYFTMVLNDSQIGGVSWSGCLVNTLSISAEVGDALSITLDLLGKDEALKPEGYTFDGSIQEDGNPYRFTYGSIFKGDEEISRLRSFTLSYNNNAIVGGQDVDSTPYPSDIQYGHRGLTIETESTLDSENI